MVRLYLQITAYYKSDFRRDKTDHDFRSLLYSKATGKISDFHTKRIVLPITYAAAHTQTETASGDKCSLCARRLSVVYAG